MIECCENKNVQLFRVEQSNKSIIVKNCCSNCYQRYDSIKKTIEHNNLILLTKDFLDSKDEERREIRSNNFKLEREAEHKEWLQLYSNYLNSDEWFIKRAKVLRRDNFLCQNCLINNASQVHHTTYKGVDVYNSIYNEALWDLKSVCKECHEKLHEDS